MALKWDATSDRPIRHGRCSRPHLQSSCTVGKTLKNFINALESAGETHWGSSKVPCLCSGSSAVEMWLYGVIICKPEPGKASFWSETFQSLKTTDDNVYYRTLKMRSFQFLDTQKTVSKTGPKRSSGKYTKGVIEIIVHVPKQAQFDCSTEMCHWSPTAGCCLFKPCSPSSNPPNQRDRTRSAPSFCTIHTELTANTTHSDDWRVKDISNSRWRKKE